MVFKGTEEEKRKQIVEGWKENAFVEAGAGAGKTTLIVNRVVEQLKNGIRPESLVIITFTNMAAEELRSRITNEVQKAAQQGLLDIEDFDMDLMQISTIHSFCFTLLKERTFDARLPIDVELLEEEDNQAQISSAFEKWLENLSGSDWDYLDLLFEDRRQAVGYIYDLYVSLANQTSDTKIGFTRQLSGDKEYEVKCDTIIQAFTGQLLIEAENLDGNRHTSLDDFPVEYLTGYKDKNKTDGKKVLAALMNPAISKEHLAIKIIKSNGKFIKKKGKSGETADVLNARLAKVYQEKYADEARCIREESEERKYQPLVKYAKGALDFYRTNQSRIQVNNNKLIEMTRDLVTGSESAREYFAGKHKCIYVDEFQDTDHIQEELIWTLAAETNNKDVLRDGALFVVGDPKQSIYRFRGAEPEVYFSTKEKMTNLKNANVYELSDNHRSNEKIIDWVNNTFANKKNMVAGGMYIPMNCKKPLAKDGSCPDSAGNTVQTKVLSGVYKYGTSDYSQDMTSEENSQLKASGQKSQLKASEVAELISIISGLIKGNYSITDYKYDAEGHLTAYARKIEYSDFLLLCRNTTHMKEYMAGFEEAGIPVNITGKDTLMNQDAVRTFVCIYEYLANPKSARARAAAIEAMQHNKLITSESQKEQIGSLILKILIEKTQGMSSYGMANYLANQLPLLLYTDTICPDFILNSIRGKIYQLIEKVDSDQGLNKYAFSLELEKAAKAEAERMLTLEEAPNAVRFMNLHKAKGLEGNIVIIMDRSEDETFRMGRVKIKDTYYPSIFVFRNKIWCSYENDLSIVEQAMSAEAAENIRLEYVAATRAKQALIFMDALNDNALFTQDYQLDNCPSIIEECPDMDDLAGEAYGGKRPDEVITEEIGCKEAKALEPKMDVIKKVKPSDYEKTGSAIRENAKKNFTGKPLQPEIDRPAGKALGTAMHRALELYVERKDYAGFADETNSVISICVNQAVNENTDILKKEDVNIENCLRFLTQAVTAFATWAENEKIFNGADEILTELPFSYYEKNAACDVWMDGSADLVILKADGRIIVIDYKSDHDTFMTDQEAEESLKEKYTGQLKMYQHSMQKIFGDEVQVDLIIISFSYKDADGKPIEENALRIRATAL